MKIRVSLCSAVFLSVLTWLTHSASAAWIEPASDSRTIALTSSSGSTADGSNPANAPGELTAVLGIEPLAKVRLANELLYSDLQSFVCNEGWTDTKERWAGLRGVESIPS
jgi:hypothetical protein